MKLYDNPGGTNPKKVRMFLAEKGLDIPRQQVDFASFEHRKDPFLKINSLGRLPALELDDGTILTESVSICRYLEELNPQPNLFGTTPLERAQIDMWIRRTELEIGVIGSMVLRHSIPFFKDTVTQVPAYAEAAKKDYRKKLEWLDKELSDGRDFLAAGRFTMADITGYIGFYFLKNAGIDLNDGSMPHVKRYHDAMAARPSASV